MAMKRETPVKRKSSTKTLAAPKAAPFDSIAAIAPDATELRVTSVDDDPEVRRRLIAMEAYYLAERRGFLAGHEEEDWYAAEATILSRMAVHPR